MSSRAPNSFSVGNSDAKSSLSVRLPFKKKAMRNLVDLQHENDSKKCDQSDDDNITCDEELNETPTKKRRRDSNVCTETLHELKWEKMYKALVAYKAKYGDCLVPNRCKENVKLGSWVSTQRRQYKAFESGRNTTILSKERIDQLNSIGFVWSTSDPRRVSWEVRYSQLCDFHERFGNSMVPMGWEENVPLSNWVSVQRQEYKNLLERKATRMTAERIRLLQSVDFIWKAPRGARPKGDANRVRKSSRGSGASSIDQNSVGHEDYSSGDDDHDYDDMNAQDGIAARNIKSSHLTLADRIPSHHSPTADSVGSSSTNHTTTVSHSIAEAVAETHATPNFAAPSSLLFGSASLYNHLSLPMSNGETPSGESPAYAESLRDLEYRRLMNMFLNSRQFRYDRMLSDLSYLYHVGAPPFPPPYPPLYPPPFPPPGP